MNARLLLLLPLAVHAGAALAQYKCTAADGAVTFQQAPCVGAKTSQKLDIVPDGRLAASGASPAAAGSVDKRMLADYERQDRRIPLVKALRQAQDEAAAQRRQHDADVAAVREKFAQEPPDSPLLAKALSDVDSRYRAFAVIAEDHIQAAQAALDAWDKANAAPAR